MAENILTENEEKKSVSFVEQIVIDDLAAGKNGGRIQTRFPPEPNGYLHIGHCKALTIDFSTAEHFGGICNLRFDDTNPAKEDVEYVDSIKEDIEWLGFKWNDCFYASQYFDFIYECAIKLIKKGKAYVCDLTADEIREYRGTLTQPGKNSPYRDRSIEENLNLFERMTKGEFADGEKTLRAKIDMTSPNINMRDPVIYRIAHISHHQTGDKWCVYPMYDFAHPLSDAKEKVTYSLCSLEFENHRPLYDWFINEIGFEEPPRQIEFARLGINYTVMSKRKLRQLVENGYVAGWDDPRMPTLCGLRRRGYTAKSIRSFCDTIGVAKNDSTVDWALLESCLRKDLDSNAKRVMAGLDPVKLTITNYPEIQSEMLPVENHPKDETMGTREVSFSRHLYIECEDFEEVPPPKYKRLYPGNEVRLKGAYLVTCTGCEKDENGNITEVFCEYQPDSKGGNPADGHKVKGATIHWVDAETAVDAEVRIYSYLFSDPDPDGPDKNFLDCLNPDSLKILTGCKLEAALAEIPFPEHAKDSESFQFMRQGYFCLDNKDAAPGHLVFNRSVALKDSFGK